MFGPSLVWAEANAQWAARTAVITGQIGEFKFQTILESPLFVGFAKHPLAFDLHWGSTCADEVCRSAGAKRLGLGSINTETHVVS
jgi:hypothetical protein